MCCCLYIIVIVLPLSRKILNTCCPIFYPFNFSDMDFSLKLPLGWHWQIELCVKKWCKFDDHHSLWWSMRIVFKTAQLLDLHKTCMFHFFNAPPCSEIGESEHWRLCVFLCAVQVGLKAKTFSWVSRTRICFWRHCSKHWRWNVRCWSARQWVVVTYCRTWWCLTRRHAASEHLHSFHWLRSARQGSPTHSIIVVRYAPF